MRTYCDTGRPGATQRVIVPSGPKRRRLITPPRRSRRPDERERERRAQDVRRRRGGHCVVSCVSCRASCVRAYVRGTRVKKGFRVAYARKSSWRSSRPWISSPSVVRNDPRSCRENLSRALVLGSRQEKPRGFRRGGQADVGGGDGRVEAQRVERGGGVGEGRWGSSGWRWSCSEVERLVPTRSEDQEGRGGPQEVTRGRGRRCSAPPVLGSDWTTPA